MKKNILILFLVSIFALSISSFQSENIPFINYESSFKVLTSEKDLSNIIRTMKRKDFFNHFYGTFRETNLAANSDAISSYTKTNNQIENIDEADVLKTNGLMTYFIDNNVLYAYQTNPNKAIGLLFKHDFSNENSIFYNNLLLFDDYLIVLGQSYTFSCYGTEDCMIPMDQDIGSDASNSTKEEDLSSNNIASIGGFADRWYMMPQIQQILVYKIAESTLELQDEFEIEGMYLGARMVENFFFLITNKDNYFSYREESTINSEDLLPHRFFNKEKIDPKINEIVVNEPESLNMLTISKLNVTTSKLESLSYMNNASQILLYQDILFVASQNYDYQNSSTEIASFNVDTLQPLSSQIVEGYLLNSFAMDYYNNHLRLALTTNDQNTTSNRLVILDQNLQLTSSINNLAKEERIYSVLFKQDKAYVVTFKEIDPFFVFDLSNPSNPLKLSELKIPGFSNYLHQVDENTIVGFGKDVKLEQGFVQEASLKISMFDVSDGKNPKESDVLMLGNDFASSEVLYNHRSLMVDNLRKWFGFVLSDYTVVMYESDSSISSTNYYQQFILVDASNQNLSILYQQQSILNQYFIRSILVNDTLFLFSNIDVTIINIATFESSILNH